MVEDITTQILSSLKELEIQQYNLKNSNEQRTASNADRIISLVSQGTKMENFMSEIISMIKTSQQKSKTATTKTLEFERNNDLFRREIQDVIHDFQNRYQYFQECIQGDITTIMRTQRDTNTGLEKFVEMVEERTSNFEEATTSKIKKFEEYSKDLESTKKVDSGGSGGSLDIERVHKSVDKVKVASQQSQEDISVLKRRFDNFRNEVNKLLVDFESEVETKNVEYSNAILSISKKLGIANPLR